MRETARSELSIAICSPISTRSRALGGLSDGNPHLRRLASNLW